MDSNLTKWRSPRTVKRKQFFDDENLPYVNEERFRACEKAGCPAKKPTCCARFDETCAGAGYTSRWYHMSDGEHFCNACFDYMYRSCKDGYETYTNWKYDWSASGQREASVKVYVSEMIMPFWVQCTLCSKWREFPQQQFSTEDIKTWKCTSSIIDVVKTKTKVKRKAVIPCSIEEDERVSAVNCAGWLESLTESPLLQSCPAAPFLSSYFPDGVGLSPTINNWKQNDSTSTGYVNLFHHPEDTQTALTFRPDIMEKEEIEAFPEFARYPMVYLALRNLVLSLWMLNHKEFLTPEKCAHHIILRGLVRVLMVAEVRRVLFFLGKKGIVNHGILPDVPKTLPSTQDSKVSVIVIGAGAAGLSAAWHLDNFGVQAIVVESRDRIGGRVWDDRKMFGCCVGRGAQILNGCTNNPISVLCEQVYVQ